VTCVDTSRDTLTDDQIGEAGLIAFYLPMHTATRLAAPLIARAGRVNASACLAAYGLYAPLNASWLGEQGVTVLGPDAEADLLTLAQRQLPTPNFQLPTDNPQSREPRAESRRRFMQPDRVGLPPLARYASLQMPDGSRKVVGSTDATRGCKHLCRHCPIVPVYGGTFRAIPIDVVVGDVRAQVAAGAEHISFGDPDFFNGPTHARRIVEAVAKEFPRLTYDVTIKIEHILRHVDMLGRKAQVDEAQVGRLVRAEADHARDAVAACLGRDHVEEGIVEMPAQVGHAEQPLAVGEAFAMQVGDFGRRRQGVLEIEIADVAKGRRKVVHG